MTTSSRRAKVVVLSSNASMRAEPHTAKLEEVLREKRLPFEFWGWYQTGDPEPSPGSLGLEENIKHLLATRRRGKLRLAIDYLRWMNRVFLATLRGSDHALYYCNRFDTAFPVAVASALQNRSYIFANRDNISLSYNWPGFFASVLAAAERFVAARATLHIVPGVSRWPTPSHNLRVIPNTPTLGMFELAKERAKTLEDNRGSASLVLYVSGWLSERRGLGTLLEAIQKVDQSQVRLIVAGDPACQAAHKLIKLPNVHFLGRLSAVDALALCFRSDLIFSFYDPAIAINRLAEPNKWGDCIACRVPFVTNTEVESARPFIEAGACFAVPYRDAAALGGLLNTLCTDPSVLDAVRGKLGAFYAPPWDVAMGRVLLEAIDSAA